MLFCLKFAIFSAILCATVCKAPDHWTTHLKAWITLLFVCGALVFLFG